MKIEIVKFENGKYGIRRKERLMFFMVSFEFLSRYGDHWFFKSEHIEQYCCFPDEKSARKYLGDYMNKRNKKPDVGTPVDKL